MIHIGSTHAATDVEGRLAGRERSSRDGGERGERRRRKSEERVSHVVPATDRVEE